MIWIATLMLAQTRTGHSHAISDTASARRFVQRFYDWYSPRAADIEGAHYPSRDWMMVALRTKRGMFSPELRHRLAMDEAMEDQNPGYDVGIEFEPFLAGQDFPSHYKAGAVKHRGRYWYVNVAGLRDKEWTTDQVPHLVAILEKRKSQYGWRFVNFTYPDISGNLLEILKELQKHEKK